MPKGHNTTRELVKGVRLRHVLAAQGKRIPWCDYCNRAMFQFLATEKLCPRNCGKDITALAATMGRRSRASSGRSRRHAPWNASAGINRFSRRFNNLRVQDNAGGRGGAGAGASSRR